MRAPLPNSPVLQNTSINRSASVVRPLALSRTRVVSAPRDFFQNDLQIADHAAPLAAVEAVRHAGVEADAGRAQKKPVIEVADVHRPGRSRESHPQGLLSPPRQLQRTRVAIARAHGNDAQGAPVPINPVATALRVPVAPGAQNPFGPGAHRCPRQFNPCPGP